MLTAKTKTVYDKTIKAIENNDLCIAGDGSVRDQLGAHAWCLTNKQSDTPFFTTTGPNDGSQMHMKALRAEATHVLASMSYVCSLEENIKNTTVTIPIYTDCQTLINRVREKYINRPIMSWRIRWM